MLNQRKIWSSSQDQILTNLCMKNAEKIKNQTIKWSFIAQSLTHEKPDSMRSGKQCRERWYNHLNPDINKKNAWTLQEKNFLLNLHDQFGNHWTTIALYFEGVTDNCIKNYIHSTLKKGLRVLNLYLYKNRKFKQFRFRNTKQYKEELLTKLLTFSHKGYKLQCYDQDYWISTNQENIEQIGAKVYHLSSKIVRDLMFLQDAYLASNINWNQRSSYCPISQFENIIINILNLNSICRKRKSKNQKSRKSPIYKQKIAYQIVKSERIDSNLCSREITNNIELQKYEQVSQSVQKQSNFPRDISLESFSKYSHKYSTSTQQINKTLLHHQELKQNMFAQSSNNKFIFPGGRQCEKNNTVNSKRSGNQKFLNIQSMNIQNQVKSKHTDKKVKVYQENNLFLQNSQKQFIKKQQITQQDLQDQSQQISLNSSEMHQFMQQEQNLMSHEQSLNNQLNILLQTPNKGYDSEINSKFKYLQQKGQIYWNNFNSEDQVI